MSLGIRSHLYIYVSIIYLLTLESVEELIIPIFFDKKKIIPYELQKQIFNFKR